MLLVLGLGLKADFDGLGLATFGLGLATSGLGLASPVLVLQVQDQDPLQDHDSDHFFIKFC